MGEKYAHIKHYEMKKKGKKENSRHGAYAICIPTETPSEKTVFFMSSHPLENGASVWLRDMGLSLLPTLSTGTPIWLRPVQSLHADTVSRSSHMCQCCSA